MSFQIKRGTNSQRLGYTAASGELIYATDTKILYVGDGTTPGGVTVGTVTSVGASAGVSSINGLSGAVVFSAGSGLTLTISGNTLTFASTGVVSGITNYVQSINGSTGVITNVVFTNLGQTFTSPQGFLSGTNLLGPVFSPLNQNDINGVCSSALFGPRLTFIDCSEPVGANPPINPYTSVSSITLSKERKSLCIGGPTGQFQAGYTATSNTVQLGYNNQVSSLAIPSSIIIGNNNLGNTLISATNLILFATNSVQEAATLNDTVIIGNVSSATATTVTNNVLLGINQLSGSAPTIASNVCIGDKVGQAIDQYATNNVLIGTDIGTTVASTAFLNGNVIVGHKAASSLDFGPTASGMTGSVIIGPAYLTGLAASSNVTRTPSATLGSNQLMIGSGRTAWITGSSSGFIGLAGTRVPEYSLHVNGDIYAGGTYVYIKNASTPSSAGASGTTGAIAWDSNFLYVCIGTDTWKRTGLTTW